MAIRKPVKVPSRSGYWIESDAPDEEYSIRYATRREAERAIEAREHFAAAAIEMAIEARAARIEAIAPYLALRAWRRAEDAKQLTFDFNGNA